MENSKSIIQDSWNEWSDTWYVKYRTDEAISKIRNRPESVFHPVTYELIRKALPDLQGKRICVPSSGDNHAVFAFHLMGAQVTSVDISERQMENASAIARKQRWEIEFVCDDTMKLSKVKSSDYDFVYTSNGVHVWINDLEAMYTQIHRILKSSGSYIMFDIHPFMRPFGMRTAGNLKVIKPYDATGPFGDIPTYKWRMQDILNAALSSGLTIRHMEEMYAENGSFWVDESSDVADTRSKEELDALCDWNINPLAAIPQWLSFHAVKK
ncbi:class I SAM-dependent methyltransferase [Paenibacillus sp. NPDC056579]|uniref:class I SAM-dependent methyltransferase n=1 Tax=Paenibacillus sp. NPDC056579 TaxID=3345871 RepID=UPI0036ABEBD4